MQVAFATFVLFHVVIWGVYYNLHSPQGILLYYGAYPMCIYCIMALTTGASIVLWCLPQAHLLYFGAYPRRIYCILALTPGASIVFWRLPQARYNFFVVFPDLEYLEASLCESELVCVLLQLQLKR